MRFDFRRISPAKKKSGLAALLLAASLGVALWNHRGRPQVVPTVFPLVTRADSDALRSALSRNHSAVREVDLDGNTALHIAAVVGNAEIAEILLSGGANANAVNNRGETPLLSAIIAPRNTREIVKLLLAAGADPKQKVAGSATILHVAARVPSIDPAVLALLIRDPAQLAARDETGKTPLDVARERSNSRFLSVANQLARN